MGTRARNIASDGGRFSFAIGLCFLFVATVFLVSSETQMLLASERGPIEVTAIFLWLTAGLLVLIRRKWWEWLHVALAYWLLAERKSEAAALTYAPVLQSWLELVDLWLDNWIVRILLLSLLVGGAVTFSVPWLRRVWAAHGSWIARTLLLALLVAAVGQGLEAVADDVAVGWPEHYVRLLLVEEMAETLLAGIMLWLAWRTRAL